MKVQGRTPRTDLIETSMIQKIVPCWDRWVQEYGWSSAALDVAMSNFCKLSARVVFDPGEVDFELAEVKDSAEDLERKFLIYMDSQSIQTDYREGISSYQGGGSAV